MNEYQFLIIITSNNMKKFLSILMLLGLTLGLQAEKLPFSGGYHWAVKNLSGEVKVTFTSDYGDLGLCSNMPISMTTYKGFRVEFKEGVSAQLQLKVNAGDGDKYYPATEGATSISLDFSDSQLAGGTEITTLNLQSNKANVSCTLKNAWLIKADNTEELCYYDTGVGYNKTVEVYSGEVEFKQQYAQIGDWSGVAGDVFKVTFGSAVPASTFQWKYTDASGDHYTEIAAGTEATITPDADFTGMCLQMKASSYTATILSIEKNPGTGGNEGGNQGGSTTPAIGEGSLPITGLENASIDVALPVGLQFTADYADIGLCKDLPLSMSEYKGVRVEFASAITSNLQLKVNAGNGDKYYPATEGATSISLDFSDSQLAGGTEITTLNLQANTKGESCTVSKIVLIKADNSEVASSLDTSKGYNTDVEAYSGNVTFLKQYAKVGNWSGVAGDTYQITFGSAIPASTFQWKYTDSQGDHYTEIPEGTEGSITLSADFTGLCLQYKGSSEQTFFIKSIVASVGGTSGIGTFEKQSHDTNACYTLSGVRVDRPTKGIFILNGKKVVIK